MRTLVLGLGNPILRDDGIGLRVVQEVEGALSGQAEVEVGEETHGGLRLMERLVGYDSAIIIDAMCSGSAPGTVRRLTPDMAPTKHSASAHDVDLPTALAVGRKAGARLPEDRRIRLVAIEAEDVLNFGEDLTPAVDAAIPIAVEAVLLALTELRSSP